MAESRQWLVEFVDLRIKWSNSNKKKKLRFLKIKIIFGRIQFVSDQATALESTFVDEKKRHGTHNQALSLVVVQQRKTNGYSIGFFCPIGWFA
jgi:hypothetical protein